LDWEYTTSDPVPLPAYVEPTLTAMRLRKKTKNKMHNMILNSYQRRDMLYRIGYSLEEIKAAEKQVDKVRFHREMTVLMQPILKLGDEIVFKANNAVTTYAPTNNSKRRHDALSVVLDTLESQVRKEQQLSLHGSTRSQVGSFHSQSQESVESGDSNAPIVRPVTWRSTFHDDGPMEEDLYVPSQDSKFTTYAVKVDKSHHDQAIQVVLCNFTR
jgi:hypothetical protein